MKEPVIDKKKKPEPKVEKLSVRRATVVKEEMAKPEKKMKKEMK